MNVFSSVLSLCLLLWCIPTAMAVEANELQRTIHRQGSMGLEQLLRNELREAKRDRRGVIVMFTADWCAPCKSVKEHVAESAEVMKALQSGRILFIDVDEWRGPAHRLFPGINPTKLPTLVSLDPRGTVLRECKGTDLGLLSAVDTARNLGRLLRGLAPEPAGYMRDSALRTKLIRESAQKQKARQKGRQPVSVEVMSVEQKKGLHHYKLRIQIHNLDGMRRWYAISDPGSALEAHPPSGPWTLSAFEEHPRSRIWRYEGSAGFSLVPVGGNGSLELREWSLVSRKKVGELHVWQLDGVQMDGARLSFEKKLPYALTIEDAGRIRELPSGSGPRTLEWRVGDRHVLPIP